MKRCESVHARRERIAGELAEARRAAAEALERARQVESLARELAEADTVLRAMSAASDGALKHELPLLDRARVATPCSASWDSMEGDDRVRFCGQCAKNVYNLSGMTRVEAEVLLREKEHGACVRLCRRADGTVMTSDCPVGVRRRRRKRALLAVVGGSMVAAAAALARAQAQHTVGDPSAPVVETRGAPITTHPVAPAQAPSARGLWEQGDLAY
jgi:hypothetical protein